MSSSATIRLPNNWRPRPYQLPLWGYLEGGGKRALAIWHRRAGKDNVGMNWTATQCVERPAIYWHLLPKANQGRKVVWNAVNPHTGTRLIDHAFPQEIRSNTREDEMSIRFKTGALWQVVGSDNADALVGSPPLGVVFSEWALADPRAWALLRPILLENGGWAIFITTPRGYNHAHRMLEAAKDDPLWFAEVLKADQTNIFTPEQLHQERAEYLREYGLEEGEDLFEQEYFCSFDSAIRGAYYRMEIKRAEEEGRIGHVPYDRAVPVYTSWDIGVGDDNAIWFWQFVGKERHLIDYEFKSGWGIQQWAKLCQDKPYVYAEHNAHNFPHDINAREWGNEAKTRLSVAKGLLGDDKVKVVPKHAPDDRIHKARQIFDSCWFDETNCEHGLDGLRNYHREWDEDRKVFKSKPEHDWTSHPADSFGYGAIGIDLQTHTPAPMRDDEFISDMP